MARTVQIEDGVEALANPCFIVRKGNVHYVCIAALEYDPGQVHGNPQKEKGVHHIHELFDKGVKHGALHACELLWTGELPPPHGGNQSGGQGGGHAGGPGGGGGVGPAAPDEPPPAPPPPPPPPPPPAEDPPGIQTEPPGMQTSP